MKKQLLAATLTLALTGGAFAAAKPEQIPADAKGVFLIQPQAFLKSPFMKAAEAKLPPGALDASETEPIGPKEIKDATVFFNEKWVGVVIEAPGKAAEAVKAAAKDGKSKTIAGKTVWTNPGGQPALIQLNANELLLIAAFDDNDKALEDAVAYLLNPKTPKLAATSPFAAVLKAKPGQYLYGAVTDVNKMLAANPEYKQQFAAMPGADAVQRIVMSLSDADQGGIRLATKLVADTAEHGAQIQEGLLGMKAMMGMAVAQMPPLAPIHKSFTVKQAATVTDASITLRVSDIEALMGVMMPMIMGGGSAPMPMPVGNTDMPFPMP